MECMWLVNPNQLKIKHMVLMSEQFDTICFVKHDHETIKSQKISKQAHNVKKGNTEIWSNVNSCKIQMGHKIQYYYIGVTF